MCIVSVFECCLLTLTPRARAAAVVCVQVPVRPAQACAAVADDAAARQPAILVKAPSPLVGRYDPGGVLYSVFGSVVCLFVYLVRGTGGGWLDGGGGGGRG